MITDVEEFLAEHNYSDTTVTCYTWQLRKLDTWLRAEKLDLRDMTPARFMAYLKAHDAWGQSFRHQALCAMRAYVRWRFGEEHPALRARLKHVENGPQRTLSEKEVEKVLGYLTSRAHATRLRRIVTYAEETRANPKAIRDLALVSTLLDTGLRASEICRLAIGDLDLERLTCSVMVKGRRWRTAVLSPVTRDRIVEWLNVRPQSRADNLFLSIGGKTPGDKLTGYGLKSIVRQMARAVGVAHFSPHAFRRTMATLAIRKGASTRLTQLMGGWSSPELVERYTQVLTPEDAAPFLPTSTIGQKESAK